MVCHFIVVSLVRLSQLPLVLAVLVLLQHHGAEVLQGTAEDFLRVVHLQKNRILVKGVMIKSIFLIQTSWIKRV